jgi:hypothetical protein
LISKHLYKDTEKAIQHIYNDLGADFNQRSMYPSEIDFVKYLITYGIGHVLQAWAPYFTKGLSCSISGFFCHQKPLVFFPPGNRLNGDCCEIADLLIIRRHYVGNSASLQHATLIQTKKKKSTNIRTIPKTETTQFFLYSNWPEFQYKNSYFKGTRKISDYDFLQREYSIIRDYRSINWRVGKKSPLYIASNKIKGPVRESFAKYLIRLLFFQRGRQYYNNENKDSDDWSKVINELIRLNYSRLSNKNNLNISIPYNFKLADSQVSKRKLAKGIFKLSCFMNNFEANNYTLDLDNKFHKFNYLSNDINDFNGLMDSAIPMIIIDTVANHTINKCDLLHYLMRE